MLVHRFQALLRSPFAGAVLISCSVAAGALLATVSGGADMPVEKVERIAKLEARIDAMNRDIDFVAARMGDSINRNENSAVNRFTQIDTTFARLTARLDGARSDRMVSAPAAGKANDSVLRPSMNELAAAQSAISEITKRLDRIEVRVGMSTDTEPQRVRHVARRKAVIARKAVEPSIDLVAQTERILLNLRPAPAAKPGKTLRVSTLRD
jgi:hypothetical protein